LVLNKKVIIFSRFCTRIPLICYKLHMRFKLLCLTLFMSSHAFACTEVMKPYEIECKAQDRWNALSKDFSSKEINLSNIKGFAIPRVLGKNNYFQSKNEFLTKPEVSLLGNKDWMASKRGKDFFKEYNPVFLELSDIQKLHKTMYAENIDAGKIRIFFGQTNPRQEIKCSDKLINDDGASLFENYDLKSYEGYPLIAVENLSVCDDKKSYSATIVFYKGASMKTELKRWLVDYNDILNRFANGNANIETTPFNYLADMKRWFLAIHPFTYGNETLANALIDYATTKLELPPLALSRNSFLINTEANRSATLKSTQESLTFLENCLFDVKLNSVAPECTSL